MAQTRAVHLIASTLALITCLGTVAATTNRDESANTEIDLTASPTSAAKLTSPTTEPSTARKNTPGSEAEVVIHGIDGDRERAAWAFDQFTDTGHALTNLEVRFAAEADEQQQVLVDFALERFAKAGLVLPPDLVIGFPDDQSRCFGYGGLYVPSRVEVRICRPSNRTMVHELAHAWIETTLDEEARQAFLELRGLDTWSGGSDWDGRGAEHAAEVLTWALMDRDITVRWLVPGPNNTSVETFRLFKIENSTYEELVDAYQLLTGTDPVDRNARSLAVETGSDLSSPEARRSGPAHTTKVGSLRHNGVIVSPEAIPRVFASAVNS